LKSCLKTYDKQLLTKKIKIKSLAWAKEHKNWTLADWKRLMFFSDARWNTFLHQKQALLLCEEDCRRKCETITMSYQAIGKTCSIGKTIFWDASATTVGLLFPVQRMMTNDQ